MVQIDVQESPVPNDLSQSSMNCVAQSEQSSSSLAAANSTTGSSSTPSDFSLRRRSSAFVEVGLSGDDAIIDAKLKRVESRPQPQVRFRSEIEVHEAEDIYTTVEPPNQPSFTKYFAPSSLAFPSMPRIFLMTFLLALALPSLQNSPFLKAGISPIGAKAGPIKTAPLREVRTIPEDLVARDNSPVNICTRWSHQSAIVNNTLYIYGGRAKTSASQTSNTWNNDFLALDLATSWQISSPSLQGLAQPSGPPAVANGFLWNSDDALYLYGGEYSDNPVVNPSPFSLWSYDIASSTWNEFQNPQTSAGDDSDAGGQPVQNAAEGAGLTVPSLGRGYYFGGHLDVHTTADWSLQIARVYLTSLLEFTFPGYSNPSISNNNQAAGSSGLFRNITQGGLQDTASFPERADGVLVYVPGFGADGIILGLAGGNNDTFTQMNVIDVFDIANSTWYKQSTSGPTPPIRVNPCAIAQSAADGSSIQVYMYGGQNLVPAGNQIQYDDVWILTLPSFTWIKVDTTNQSVPPARAGHTCNSWNSQMVVVGGYVGTQLECDTPGIYIFNLSSLTWQNTYAGLQGGNYLNQQQSQEKDAKAMSGTYDYQVPAVVQSVIGGSGLGGATVTAPAQTATAGPFATGSPITYTVTGSNGAIVTETGSPNAGPGGIGSSTGGGGSKGANVGAIVAGVIAGIFAALAAYLGFCTWVYRRQLHLYKNHVAMAQRAHLGVPGILGAGIPAPGAKFSEPSSGQKSSFDARSKNSGEASATASGNASGRGSGRQANPPLASNNPYLSQVNGNTSTANSSTEDLMSGQEPSFLGVFLNPRRSLRVVNRD